MFPFSGSKIKLSKQRALKKCNMYLRFKSQVMRRLTCARTRTFAEQGSFSFPYFYLSLCLFPSHIPSSFYSPSSFFYSFISSFHSLSPCFLSSYSCSFLLRCYVFPRIIFHFLSHFFLFILLSLHLSATFRDFELKRKYAAVCLPSPGQESLRSQPAQQEPHKNNFSDISYTLTKKGKHRQICFEATNTHTHKKKNGQCQDDL